MTNKLHVLAGALTVSFLVSGIAVAADRIVVAALGELNGKVLVNSGKGYVAAKPGMDIAVGDRVIALDSASAKIVYSDGCVTDLKENNLVGIEGKSCEAKPVNPHSNPIRLAQAIGSGGGGTGGGAGGGAGGMGTVLGLSRAMTLGLMAGTFVVGSSQLDDPISKQ